MNTKRNSTNSSIRPALTGFLSAAALLSFTAGTTLACETVCVDFNGATCPPNGYNGPGDCTDRQPPYNCCTDGDPTTGEDNDLDGDGMIGPGEMGLDGWCDDIDIDRPGGGTTPTTDSCGKTAYLPCVPDPAGDGKGGDYFSPRIVCPGGTPGGDEVGQCVYPCGRNSWKINMCDTTGDGTPDKFMSSKWVSEKYIDTDGDGRWDSPSGTETTFCEDLASPITAGPDFTTPDDYPMIIVSSSLRDPNNVHAGYRITDAVLIYNEYAALADVILDGRRIGTPDENNPVAATSPSPTPSPTASASSSFFADTATISRRPIDDENDVVDMYQEGTDPDVVIDHKVDAELKYDTRYTARGANGDLQDIFLFNATVSNPDSVGHFYEIMCFGIDVDVSQAPINFWLEPGASADVPIECVRGVAGQPAIATIIYNDASRPGEAKVLTSYIDFKFLRPGDLNSDGDINSSDLSLLMSQFGLHGERLPADFDESGQVDSRDMAILLGNWGSGAGSNSGGGVIH